MNTKTLIRAIGLAVILPLPAAFVAAEDVSHEDELQEIDVVTIIGHQSDVADVAGSAHVVDSEELGLFKQSDIMRVLRTVPGVYVQEEDGYGLRPNIGIRGSGLDRSARIALLEDGVLIAPAPYSAASAYYFPTQRRMSMLEVLKGPAAVAVGPRTTGGAINMISTRIPTEFSANLDIRAGADNAIDTVANIGNDSGQFSWLLETVQQRSDGFKSIDGPVGGDTGYEINDYIAKLQFDSDPSSDIYHSLRLKLGYTEQDSDETYLGLTQRDFDADPYRRYAASANDNFKSEHEQVVATYVIDPGSSWRGQITAYRNNFKRNWYKLQSVGGQGLGSVLEDPTNFATEFGYLTGATSPDDALQIRANNREYYSQGVQGRVEFDLGVGDVDVLLNTGFRIHEDEEDRFQKQDGYRMDNGTLVLTSPAAEGSQTNRVSDADAQSVFVNAQIRAGQWIVTPGVRYETIDLRRLDYATSDPTRGNGPTRVRENSVSVVIPGIGAIYQVNDHWRVLAGIHEGFNPPGPGSSAAEETSLNFEAGVRYNNRSLSFEGIWFLNDYDNLVGTVTDSTGGGSQIGEQFDGGEVTVAGFELSVGRTFGAGNVEVPLSLKYTWTYDAEFENSFESDFDPWGDVTVGDELPYIPEHQFRASAGVRLAAFSASIAANYVGKMRTHAGQGSYDPLETIESHTVWDLTGIWAFTNRLSTYVKIDNLFDKDYVASRRPAGARPGLPRTAYLGLTYRL